jgi:hypothetical protein
MGYFSRTAFICVEYSVAIREPLSKLLLIVPKWHLTGAEVELSRHVPVAERNLSSKAVAEGSVDLCRHHVIVHDNDGRIRSGEVR